MDLHHHRGATRRTLALALLTAALPALPGAQAQTVTPIDSAQSVASESASSESAMILADHMALSSDTRLTASGNVQIYYDGRQLSAQGLDYDRATDRLTLRGPIRLTDPSAEGSVILADAAQLSGDLREGILEGARLVMARQLQLAADTITRREGRWTDFEHVVTSSCRVCRLDPTPIWEIRAERITHDAETRRLHFTKPRLRAFGLPLLGLPALTLPDPTVTRAAGILAPSFRSNSTLGIGVELPWFQPIGDHHDLTITPLLTTENARSLGLAGRHAFRSGKLSWQGAVTRDNILPGETRGYLFGAGSFALPRDYRLGLQVQASSDDDYLSDYDVSSADRLWSGITLDRVRRNKMVFASLGYFHSLRSDELNSTSPGWVGTLDWSRRFTPRLLGGEASLGLSATGFRRSSSEDVIGRDMARVGLRADWRRNWLLPQGFLAAAEMGLAVDHYQVWDDPSYPDPITRIDPTAALELRWPLISHGSKGATHVLEPVMRLDLSRNELEDVPNEDSRLAEFDEGNLFAPSRFAGADLRETGLRLALGASWTRMDPAGWSLGLTAGRIWRGENPLAATAGELSAGRRSDWLLAAHYSNDDGFRLSNRALISDKLRIRRNETRIAWQNARTDLSAAYVWIRADEIESRDTDLSEFLLDSTVTLGRGWTGGLEMRYDLSAHSAEKIGASLGYANECVSLDLSLSRERSSSSTVSYENNVNLSVRLTGFGSSAGQSAAATPSRCLR